VPAQRHMMIDYIQRFGCSRKGNTIGYCEG